MDDEYDINNEYYHSEDYLKFYRETLEDIFERNHDMTFIYKGVEMFLSFAQKEDGTFVRGIFKWPGGWDPIVLFSGDRPEDVLLDGKTFYELEGEIVITSVY